MDSIIAVSYLLRKTGMTLTEIRGLTPEQFADLYEEVGFQESVEGYERNHQVANVLAVIANTVQRKSPKTYRVSDFLTGSPPNRDGVDIEVQSMEALKALAAKFNIRLPGREIIEL